MVAETITGRTGDSLSALLLAPSADEQDEKACIDLLTPAGIEETNVLSVSLSESPAERFGGWHRQMGDALPHEATIVAAAGAHTESTEFPENVTVDSLPEDAELVDVGMVVARHVGRWSSEKETTALCLHSLSALLEEYERDQVIGFVNAVNELSDRERLVAHHHMDPAAHDDATIESFRPLYDVVLEHVPDHGWTVWEASDRASAPTFRGSTVPPGGDSGATPASPPTVPIPYSFDTVLDLVSAERRRTLLYYLKDCTTAMTTLDDIVDGVVARERSIPKRDRPGSRRSVATALRHVHLPKLADVGIVDFDSETGSVRYHQNEALEACLQYIETLELG